MLLKTFPIMHYKLSSCKTIRLFDSYTYWLKIILLTDHCKEQSINDFTFLWLFYNKIKLKKGNTHGSKC